MKRIVAVALLALLPAAPSFAKKAAVPADPAAGPPSKAVTNEIVDAIAEEMNRATQELVIPGAPRPYSISYKITEVDVNNVAASLGQFCVIQALRYGQVSLLAPLEYSALIWATSFGFIFWGEFPTPTVLLGAMVIILSSLYVVQREALAARRARLDGERLPPHLPAS